MNSKMIIRFALVCVPLGLAGILFSGCSSTSASTVSVRKATDHPMLASLDWMTFETDDSIVNGLSGTVFKRTARWCWGLLGYSYINPNQWSQRTVVSVNGTLPVRDVGEVFYWQNSSSPSQALQIGSLFNAAKTNKSRSAVGVVCEDTNAVQRAHIALEKLQQHTLDALKAATELSVLTRSGTNRTWVENQRATNLLESITNLSAIIGREKEEVLTNLMHPGIIVFRWARATNVKGGIRLGGYGDLSAEKNGTDSGYTILNGLRISQLNVGQLSKRKITNVVKTGYHENWDQVGVISYLLQARQVEYARDRSDLLSFSASVNVGKLLKDLSVSPLSLDALTKLDLSLNAYAMLQSQLSAFGSVAGLNWDNKPDTNSWSSVYAVFTQPNGLVQARSHCED